MAENQDRRRIEMFRKREYRDVDYELDEKMKQRYGVLRVLRPETAQAFNVALSDGTHTSVLVLGYPPAQNENSPRYQVVEFPLDIAVVELAQELLQLVGLPETLEGRILADLQEIKEKVDALCAAKRESLTKEPPNETS